MTNETIRVVTLVAALGSGLIAGVFFAFSTFVMRALARLPPPQGIAAMQAINITVLNRIFLGAFVGTAIVCAVLAGHALFAWHLPGSLCRVVGSALYLFGTFLVTVVCHVPRNDALAAVDPGSAKAAPRWRIYVREWTTWNHVRTIAALGAAAMLATAL